MKKRLLSTSECAEYMGVSRSAFINHVLARRRLKPVSLLQGKHLYDIKDVDQLIENAKRQQDKEARRDATATN